MTDNMMRHLASRQRQIPANAIEIREPGLGSVYVYPSVYKGQAWYGVRAFREKAIKPDFGYIYKTDAEVDKKVAEFFNSLRAHKQRVADRRAEEYAGHNFHVGDIVTNSWGYDQTNVDWYMVTRTTKNYVWLRPVCATLTPGEGCGPMSGHEALSLDENLKPIFTKNGKETKHRATKDNVTMRHGCGSKYTGGNLYSSWYA